MIRETLALYYLDDLDSKLAARAALALDSGEPEVAGQFREKLSAEYPTVRLRSPQAPFKTQTRKGGAPS
jgi:hypothetical protein